MLNYIKHIERAHSSYSADTYAYKLYRTCSVRMRRKTEHISHILQYIFAKSPLNILETCVSTEAVYMNIPGYMDWLITICIHSQRRIYGVFSGRLTIYFVPELSERFKNSSDTRVFI